MRHTFTYAALILAGIILSAGCNKDPNGPKDPQIRFTAGTGTPQTRTAYSGVVSNNIERIDWLVGDRIRIWSDKATYRYDDQQFYSDYDIASVTENGSRSDGTITNTAGNGLVWDAEGGVHTFYGIYPSGSATVNPATGAVSGATIAQAQSRFGTPGTGSGSFKIDGTLKTVPTVVLHPNMSQALLFAKATGTEGSTPVRLDFYPAYTAFEISLVSDKATAIPLTSFTLSSTSSALSGTFGASIQAGNTTTYTCPAFAAGTNDRITFDLSGQSVSKTAGLTFTVFALPQDLTNLQIRFDLADGTFRSLELKQNGAPITFTAGKKHRLLGIAMPDQPWIFALQLGPEALAWELIQDQSSYSSQVSADGFHISHAQETGESYEAYNGNPYYYQVRTLDSGTHDYFEVQFTPMAPMGGTWYLSVAPALAYDQTSDFHVEVWDSTAGTGSTVLSGPILSLPVTLRISLSPNANRNYEHAMTLKALFSPSGILDEAVSADSELQYPNANGSFAWWKFVFSPQI